MCLIVLSFFLTVFRQCCHCISLFVNILAIFLLFFIIVVLNPSFLYIKFFSSVTKPHPYIMFIRTQLISLAIKKNSISRLGSLGFQLPLWSSSSYVIIWSTNIIFNFLLFILSVASVGLCIQITS